MVSAAQLHPADVMGQRVLAVITGWHVHGDDRSEEALFLTLSVHGDIEAYTDPSGSLSLLRGPAPSDFSMDEHGRFEVRACAAAHPAARLLDQTITTVERIRWNDTVIGLRLGTDNGVVAVVNDFDELFVSHGPLPATYDNVVID